MRKISVALVSAGLLALSACGGGEDAGANNAAAEDLNLATDDLTVTDNGAIPADTLANDANALGTDTTNLTNAADLNATGTANVQTNSQ